MAITLQQVFDKIVAHARQQKERAMSLQISKETFKEQMSCAYRGDEGRKCFIGACIEDAFYSPSMEGANATNTAVLKALAKSFGVQWERLDRAFSFDLYKLKELQRIHDLRLPHSWMRDLELFAKDNNLTMPPVEPALGVSGWGKV